MSRTYRRKKVSKLEDDYYTYDFIWVRGTLTRLYLTGKELKKATSIYHSEAERTMQQVPKWYKVEFCRRPFRAKEKRQVIKVLKGEEEVMFDKVVKNANYYW